MMCLVKWLNRVGDTTCSTVSRHSSHFLGICVFRFSGPNAHEQTADKVAYFLPVLLLATVVTPFQRLLLTKLFQKQTNTDEQQAIRVTKILQLTVLAACVFLSLAAYTNIGAFGTTKDVVHLVVVEFLYCDSRPYSFSSFLPTAG